MMDIDWQVNKSIPECNKYMLENEIATDVVFIVSQVDRIGRSSTKPESSMTSDEPSACKKRRVSKDQATPSPVRIKAHKYMLVSRSPVFYAMFLGPLAEQGEVTVTDCHPEAFRQMLNYLYTEEVKLTPEIMPEVRYIGKKYIITKLVKKCEDYFHEHVSPTNALQWLDYSLNRQSPYMIKMCLEVIKYHTKSCLQQKYHPSSTTVAEVLKLNVSNMKEVELFEFLIRWGETEAIEVGVDVTADNVRDLIKDLVFSIRYPVLTLTELADKVGKKDVLTPEELWSIVQFICSADKVNIPFNLSSVNRYIAEKCFTVNLPNNSVTKKKKFSDIYLELKITATRPTVITYVALGIEHIVPNLKYRLYHAVLDFEDISNMSFISSTPIPGSTASDVKSQMHLYFKHGLHLKMSCIHRLSFTLAIDPEILISSNLFSSVDINPNPRVESTDIAITVSYFSLDCQEMNYASPVASVGYFHIPTPEK